MEPSEALDPLLSSDEFDEIIEILFCHGLHKHLPNLLGKIIERFPDFDERFCSPHRQMLLLVAYCQDFQKNGPLPSIRHTMFLSTLHDSIVGLLKSEHKLVDLAGSLNTYKLVGGLRCLLARSILMNPKFSVTDIERTISSYFPTLPVKPSNYKHWASWAEILKIDLEEKSEVLTNASKVNGMSAKHLRDKLDNLPVERKKPDSDQDKSIIHVWKTVSLRFDDFVRHLMSLLPENFLSKIVENPHPKIKMLSSRLDPMAVESEVIAFLDYLCDIYVESEFWTSGFVQGIVNK
eukprot:TRINITY_DN1598_c0_g1_i4.p1 TRINITY_DN1598_c0_g1~~TRINITY_DN1598_c0_g1_i4.p1  ORF type:complete len:292 (-),score=71.45 TRINITY_DN1598_c0_g1_i4:15-890(-)